MGGALVYVEGKKSKSKAGKGADDAVDPKAAAFDNKLDEMKGVATRMFKMKDRDGDGIITREEMSYTPEGAPKASKEQEDKMFNEMDGNKDGQVTFKEAEGSFLLLGGLMEGQGPLAKRVRERAAAAEENKAGDL